MSRYIDADALIAEIKMDIEDDGLQEKMVFYRINDAPSINIVRCRECKHSCHLEDGTRLFCDSIKGLAMVVSADDYCSYGEREGE